MLRWNRFFAVILMTVILGGTTPFFVCGEQQNEVRILVLPLNGDSSGAFDYLTDSVRTMLSTRLAGKEGISVIDKPLTSAEITLLNRESAEGEEYQQILDKLNVDYLVSGALYALQSGLKIQINVAGKDIAASGRGTFTSLAVNEDHILESVEQLVGDIAVRALGVAEQSVTAAANGSSAGSGVEAFSTEHPEKIFKKGVYSGTITAESGLAVKSLGVRRSSELPAMLVSMATGDLNGDGNIEVVAASRTAVEIFRFDKTRFLKLGEYDFSKNYKIHAVNVADLDGDGKGEIYISGNQNKIAESAILRWESRSGLQPLLTDINWYIRPVVKPGQGTILAAQKGSSDPRTGYVDGGVVELDVADDFSKVVKKAVLPLPKNIRLFDFVWADLNGDGSAEIVAVDSQEKLLVYDSSNSLIYVSENDYGGSRNFVGPAKSAVTSARDMIGLEDSAKAERQMIFVPTRLLAVDLDGDGKQEIIVANNARTTPRAMVNFREYDGGSVVGLSWNDAALVELWRTNRVEGYIADYNFIDSTVPSASLGEEISTLYICQIPDKSLFGFSLNSNSKLLRYSLDIAGQE